MDTTDPGRFVDAALERLVAAPDDRDASFRNVFLATVAPDGAPRVRTVVLRRVERGPPFALSIYTDDRAGKVGDVRQRPEATLLAWSEPDKLQVRIEGSVRLARGEAARAIWDRLPPHGRDAYGLDLLPGSAVEAPDRPRPMPDDARADCFTVLTVDARRIDVLLLGPHGAQTRAIRDGSGTSWRAP